MKPIGKGYGGFDLYPRAPKRYKCDRCGHVEIQVTNHFQPTWSHDHFNVCPKCPPWAKYPEFGGQTTWTCIDTPESMDEQSMAESILSQVDRLLESPPMRTRRQTIKWRRRLRNQYQRMTANRDRVDRLSKALNAPPDQLDDRVDKLMNDIEDKKRRLRAHQADELLPAPKAAEMQVSWT